jgi:hypothetical protein
MFIFMPGCIIIIGFQAPQPICFRDMVPKPSDLQSPRGSRVHPYSRAHEHGVESAHATSRHGSRKLHWRRAAAAAAVKAAWAL